MGTVDRKTNNLHDAPLSGWRGIAAYLGRNQSTVKRWAAARDLPVHRPQGSEARKGVPVYAFAAELDTWIRGHSRELLETASEPIGVLALPDTGNLSRPDASLPSRRHMLLGLVAAGLVASGSIAAVQLTGSTATQAVSEEARALYLEAGYLWQKRTAETLLQASDLLRRALAIAPNYADAEADLAIVYNLMVEYELRDADDGYELSRRSAQRAVSLDPRHARAHSVLGDIEFFWSRNYEAGLALLRKAVALDPRDATAHHWLASALMAKGQFGEAAKEIQLARQFEPMSRSIIVSHAMIDLGQNRPARARQSLEQLIRNEPAYRSPYRFLAFAELALKNYSAYLAALAQRFALTADATAALVVARGRQGLQADGIDGMIEAMALALRSGPAPADPYFVAHWLALAGAWPEAVEQLTRTPTRRFAYYGIDPAFTLARQDDAFHTILSQAGLPMT